MQSYFSKLYCAFPCYPAPPEGKAFAYVEVDSILFVLVIKKLNFMPTYLLLSLLFDLHNFFYICVKLEQILFDKPMIVLTLYKLLLKELVYAISKLFFKEKR